MASTTTTAEPLAQHSKKRLRQRLFRSDANDKLPLTIRHERIYILPTGRGLAFLGVVAIMLLASMNYRLNLGYALSFILVGLLASTLLSTYLNLVKITFSSAKSRDTFCGTPLVFEITVTEPGHRARHSIEISTSESRDRIDIGKNNSSTALLPFASPERGIYKLGRITLSSDFPLGLWRGWGYLHTDSTSYVYPEPEVPVAPFSSNRAGNLNGQKRSEEEEFKELRAYRETDNPTSVAWKTVARGGAWYSKEFEPANSDDCDVDIRWSDIDNSLPPEQRLSRMCAWLVKAEKQSLNYEFQLPAYTSSSNQRGINHQQNCLRKLATFDIDKHL